VPWRHAERLVSRLASDDVVLTLVKDGDHRLSRPQDLEILAGALTRMVDDFRAGRAGVVTGNAGRPLPNGRPPQ